MADAQKSVSGAGWLRRGELANFNVAFSDVDSSLTIREAGYRIIWTYFQIS